MCQNDVCSFWQRLLDLLQTSQQNLTWKLSVTLQRNVIWTGLSQVYKERKKMWETCGVQRGKPQMPDNKSHMRNDIVWVGTVTSLWIHHLVSAIMRHPDAKKTWAICVCKYLNPSPFILAHWMIALHSGRSFFWHRWFQRFTLPFSQRYFLFFYTGLTGQDERCFSPDQREILLGWILGYTMNTWGRKYLIQSKKYSALGRKNFLGKVNRDSQGAICSLQRSNTAGILAEIERKQ